VGVVGVATLYGLDTAGFESRSARDFSHTSRPALGPECVLDHPPFSSSGVKERVKLYLCWPSGPSWRLLVWSLPFIFYFMNTSCLLIFEQICMYYKCCHKLSDKMQKLSRLYRLHSNVDDQIVAFLVEKHLDICRVIFLICLQATNVNKLTTTH
jgi:hypothetical protein